MKSLTSVIIKNSKRNELINRNKLLMVLAFIIVFGFLAIIMIMFSSIATIKLGQIEQSYAFVNILLFMNFIILFSESIFHSLNTLYFSKDLNIFLRLPLKPKDLVSSKMIDMIFSQYQMEILMLAIPMTTYGIISHVTLPFYLYMVVILLILPVIPIALTTLIIATIMRFTNFLKNKNKAMYVTIILAVLLMGVLLANLGAGGEFSTNSFENLVLQTNGLAQEISNRFVLIKPIMNTLLNYNNFLGFQNLLIYVIESFAVYKIVVFIVSKIYLKGVVGTIINGNRNTKTVKKLGMKDFVKNKMKKAYIIKELRTMVRTPIFLIQCILMPMIYPFITVIVVMASLTFAQKIGVDTMGELMKKANTASGYSIFLAIAQAFFMLNFSSIIGISKEGRSSILMKTFPIQMNKQFKMKTAIGTIANMIPIIIVVIAYYYCTYNWGYTLMLFISLIFLNLIGEKFKLLIDLKNPQIKWDSEYTMMKQNTNVMYELFYTIVAIAVMEIIAIIINNISLAMIVLLGVLIIVNTIIDEYIFKKQQEIFEKLYN